MPTGESAEAGGASAIASSTRWRSVGDEAITRSTSAVAVCCSSASAQLAIAPLQLLEQPGVLDGDHGLVRERFQEGNLLPGERSSRRVPVDRHDADRLALAQQGRGDGTAMSDPGEGRARVRKVRFDRSQHIGNMDGATLQHRPSGETTTRDGGAGQNGAVSHVAGTPFVDGSPGLLGGVRDGDEILALRSVHGAALAATETRSARDQCFENGLQVHGLGRDRAQHLAGHGLLFERFGKASFCEFRTLSERGLTGLRSHTQFAQSSNLRLQLRDPRVRIVRHHVHPGHTALLRDGARIARSLSCDL